MRPLTLTPALPLGGSLQHGMLSVQRWPHTPALVHRARHRGWGGVHRAEAELQHHRVQGGSAPFRPAPPLGGNGVGPEAMGGTGSDLPQWGGEWGGEEGENGVGPEVGRGEGMRSDLPWWQGEEWSQTYHG